jgi:hypothetical protein
MDLACLQNVLIHASSEIAKSDADEWFGLLLFGVVLAVPLAPVVLALYQRRVQRLMSASSKNPAWSAVPSTARADRTRRDASFGRRSTAESLLQASDLRARALWKALALAVALFSVGIAVAITISPDSAGALSRRPLWEWIVAPLGYLLFVGSLTAPMVLLGVASARFAALFWKWFAPVYIMMAGIAMIFEDAMSHAERVQTFLEGLIILVVLYVALGGRRMRNVVPLLSIIICLLVLPLLFRWLFSSAHLFLPVFGWDGGRYSPLAGGWCTRTKRKSSATRNFKSVPGW